MGELKRINVRMGVFFFFRKKPKRLTLLKRGRKQQEIQEEKTIKPKEQKKQTAKH